MAPIGDGFDHPQDVSDVKIAFSGDVSGLMPALSSIPDDYPDRLEWQKFQSSWFFDGIPDDMAFVPVEGVDARKAFRHLKTIQGSFQPTHEHKEAAVAWLASRWFQRVFSAKAGLSFPSGDQ